MPEILSTTAEVSVAFVGFAALIAVFRGSQGLRGELRTMSLIETGLLSLVFSLLPHVFAHFELAMEQVWRFSSSLLAAALALELLRVRGQNRRLVELGAPVQSPALLWIVGVGIGLVASEMRKALWYGAALSLAAVSVHTSIDSPRGKRCPSSSTTASYGPRYMAC